MEGRKGFTLIEMLVVIGIIAVLAGALMAGFGRVTKSAQRAKAQEIVSNAAAALNILYERNNYKWPEAIKREGASGKGRLNVDVTKVFARHDLMGVTYRKTSTDGTTVYTLQGTDRCGIVTPWAAAVLKRTTGGENSGSDLKVPSGGTVSDHVLYFAVDTKGDGITEAQMEGVGTVKVRARAVVWCAGADGVLDDYAKSGRTDDVYSWQKGQEQKD